VEYYHSTFDYSIQPLELVAHIPGFCQPLDQPEIRQLLLSIFEIDEGGSTELSPREMLLSKRGVR
jgi:hypothetical protein